jgi:intracellular proteinase inhibitor BsuPI
MCLHIISNLRKSRVLPPKNVWITRSDQKRACAVFVAVAVALLVSCSAAYAKHGDAKNTSRAISGVSSQFELLNTVIRSGEPIKIRVTLHNESTSPVEFRYVTGSFIEHVRIYDARHRQVHVRLNAPFLESGADKVTLQPGEQFVNVVTADLWQMYDLKPGTYELRFYYDLRLIADETLAAKSMKRYHSKDWILWDMKTYPLTVVDKGVIDSATRTKLEPNAEALRTSSTVAFAEDERFWSPGISPEPADSSAVVPQRKTRAREDYFVLFSWKGSRGDYDFALVPVNREKAFLAGFTPTRSGVGGAAALKTILATLPKRSLIVWLEANEIGLRLPPPQHIDDVVSFARTKNIRVELNPALTE